jgi:hypothetical protein
MSFNRENASGQFTHHGISWFARLLYFQGLIDPAGQLLESSDGLEELLQGYDSEISDVIQNSAMLKDLDLTTDSGGAEARRRILDDSARQSHEFWALLTHEWKVRAAAALDKGDAQGAAWAMAALSNFRAMRIFEQNLNDLIWRGYAIENLQGALKLWTESKDNKDEEFWQQTILQNPVILSQVFAFPVVIREDKAYVSGKSVNNKGGNLADFLLTNHLSNNVALVEIKTPRTNLLGPPYRANVYSISAEITGAVVQVSNYRDSLMKNWARAYPQTLVPWRYASL